jgi:two-component system cell cycle response regulator
MVDLDDFKGINDQHGHQAGDRVLRAIAGALRDAVRGGDVVARYGGDEFVVLMPDTDAAAAAVVAERARSAVASLAHAMADGSHARVSCSVGLALYPVDGKSSRDLLRKADAAMYEQKRARTTAIEAPARRSRSRATTAPVEAASEAGARPAAVAIESGPRIPV